MASKQILQEKEKQVAKLGEIFKSNGVFLFDYRGLKVSEMEDLRRRARNLNGGLMVIKNRLAIKSLEKSQAGIGREVLNGPLAVAFSGENFIEVAKMMVDYEKESKKIRIVSGFIEEKFVSSTQIAEVAKLPGREQLLAQLALSMAMPLKKMGAALRSPLVSMLVLLQNLKDKKEKGGQ